jgi:hypothetical protein
MAALIDGVRDHARWQAANELIQAINCLTEAARAGVATRVEKDRLTAAEQQWDRINGRIPEQRGPTP